MHAAASRLFCVNLLSPSDAMPQIAHNTAVFVQNMSQTLNSQKAPYILPSHASYEVPILSILEKIDRVITALHCKVDIHIDVLSRGSICLSVPSLLQTSGILATVFNDSSGSFKYLLIEKMSFIHYQRMYN